MTATCPWRAKICHWNLTLTAYAEARNERVIYVLIMYFLFGLRKQYQGLYLSYDDFFGIEKNCNLNKNLHENIKRWRARDARKFTNETVYAYHIRIHVTQVTLLCMYHFNYLFLEQKLSYRTCQYNTEIRLDFECLEAALHIKITGSLKQNLSFPVVSW